MGAEEHGIGGGGRGRQRVKHPLGWAVPEVCYRDAWTSRCRCIVGRVICNAEHPETKATALQNKGVARPLQVRSCSHPPDAGGSEVPERVQQGLASVIQRMVVGQVYTIDAEVIQDFY
jgi:hypothetical protein